MKNFFCLIFIAILLQLDIQCKIRRKLYSITNKKLRKKQRLYKEKQFKNKYKKLRMIPGYKFADGKIKTYYKTKLRTRKNTIANSLYNSLSQQKYLDSNHNKKIYNRKNFDHNIKRYTLLSKDQQFLNKAKIYRLQRVQNLNKKRKKKFSKSRQIIRKMNAFHSLYQRNLKQKNYAKKIKKIEVRNIKDYIPIDDTDLEYLTKHLSSQESSKPVILNLDLGNPKVDWSYLNEEKEPIDFIQKYNDHHYNVQKSKESLEKLLQLLQICKAKAENYYDEEINYIQILTEQLQGCPTILAYTLEIIDKINKWSRNIIYNYIITNGNLIKVQKYVDYFYLSGNMLKDKELITFGTFKQAVLNSEGKSFNFDDYKVIYKTQVEYMLNFYHKIFMTYYPTLLFMIKMTASQQAGRILCSYTNSMSFFKSFNKIYGIFMRQKNTHIKPQIFNKQDATQFETNLSRAYSSSSVAFQVKRNSRFDEQNTLNDYDDKNHRKYMEEVYKNELLYLAAEPEPLQMYKRDDRRYTDGLEDKDLIFIDGKLLTQKQAKTHAKRKQNKKKQQQGIPFDIDSLKGPMDKTFMKQEFSGEYVDSELSESQNENESKKQKSLETEPDNNLLKIDSDESGESNDEKNDENSIKNQEQQKQKQDNNNSQNKENNVNKDQNEQKNLNKQDDLDDDEINNMISGLFDLSEDQDDNKQKKDDDKKSIDADQEQNEEKKQNSQQKNNENTNQVNQDEQFEDKNIEKQAIHKKNKEIRQKQNQQTKNIQNNQDETQTDSWSSSSSQESKQTKTSFSKQQKDINKISLSSQESDESKSSLSSQKSAQNKSSIKNKNSSSSQDGSIQNNTSEKQDSENSQSYDEEDFEQSNQNKTYQQNEQQKQYINSQKNQKVNVQDKNKGQLNQNTLQKTQLGVYNRKKNQQDQDETNKNDQKQINHNKNQQQYLNRNQNNQMDNYQNQDQLDNDDFDLNKKQSNFVSKNIQEDENQNQDQLNIESKNRYQQVQDDNQISKVDNGYSNDNKNKFLQQTAFDKQGQDSQTQDNEKFEQKKFDKQNNNKEQQRNQMQNFQQDNKKEQIDIQKQKSQIEEKNRQREIEKNMPVISDDDYLFTKEELQDVYNQNDKSNKDLPNISQNRQFENQDGMNQNQARQNPQNIDIQKNQILIRQKNNQNQIDKQIQTDDNYFNSIQKVQNPQMQNQVSQTNTQMDQPSQIYQNHDQIPIQNNQQISIPIQNQQSHQNFNNTTQNNNQNVERGYQIKNQMKKAKYNIDNDDNYNFNQKPNINAIYMNNSNIPLVADTNQANQHQIQITMPKNIDCQNYYVYNYQSKRDCENNKNRMRMLNMI